MKATYPAIINEIENPICPCGKSAVDIASNYNSIGIKRFICDGQTCFYDEWYYLIDEQWKRWHSLSDIDRKKASKIHRLMERKEEEK